MSEVSILMPIYNADKYLKTCLESIQNQTFQNFEVIMVDDGSCDNSYKIAKEISEKDSRFIILRQENMGSGVARNTALDYFNLNSDSKYIVWVDSDDILDQNYLKILYSSIECKKCDIVQCSFDYIDMNKRKVGRNDERAQIVDNKNGMEMLELLFEGKRGICLAVLWNKIFARKLFYDVRVHNNNKFTGRMGDDEDILWRIYSKANEVYFIDNVLYFYRITEGSQQHSKITPRVLETFEIWLDRWIYCEEQNLSNLKRIIENKIVFVIAILASKNKTDYVDYRSFKFDLKTKFQELSKIIPFKSLRFDMKILVKLSYIFWDVFYLYGKSYQTIKKAKDSIVTVQNK